MAEVLRFLVQAWLFLLALLFVTICGPALWSAARYSRVRRRRAMVRRVEEG